MAAWNTVLMGGGEGVRAVLFWYQVSGNSYQLPVTSHCPEEGGVAVNIFFHFGGLHSFCACSEVYIGGER